MISVLYHMYQSKPPNVEEQTQPKRLKWSLKTTVILAENK